MTKGIKAATASRSKVAAKMQPNVLNPAAHNSFLDVAKFVDGVKREQEPPFRVTTRGGCAEVCAADAPRTGPHNPYYFTGQRLDLGIGTLDGTQDEDLVLYHYRARAYDARHGRFLQRDPAGYVDGTNLYEYAKSNPKVGVDPTGNYGEKVHGELTSEWAQELGMRKEAADYVGRENISTDGEYGASDVEQAFDGQGTGFTIAIAGGDQSRHFNRNPGGKDSRLDWVERELASARELCFTGSNQSVSPRDSALHLGRALHSLQDWWAHGEYGTGNRDIGFLYRHAPQYDNPYLDAVGVQGSTPAYANGRAPQVFSHTFGTALLVGVLSSGRASRQDFETQWTNWNVGTRRLTGAEQDSKAHLKLFLEDMREKGLLRCKCYFLKDPF